MADMMDICICARDYCIQVEIVGENAETINGLQIFCPVWGLSNQNNTFTWNQ